MDLTTTVLDTHLTNPTSITAHLTNTSNIHWPQYQRSHLSPRIIHVGIGGFFRAHQALYTQTVLNILHHQDQDQQQRQSTTQDTDWGIIGVGILDSDMPIHARLKSQDYIYTVLKKSPNKDQSQLHVVANLLDMYLLHDSLPWILELIASPDTAIISMTITEKGYCYDATNEDIMWSHPWIQQDVMQPLRPRSAIGVLVAGLEIRRKRNVDPLTILSCDNIPMNGQFVRKAVTKLAAKLFGEDLLQYLKHVKTPSTMVDGITPIATQADSGFIQEWFGIRDQVPTVCEPWQQWVVEDDFVKNVRPRWELAGAELVKDSNTIAQYERTKICLLNVPHSALSYAGRLLGLEYIHEGIQDPVIAKYIRKLMDDEITGYIGTSPMDLNKYKDSLVSRFANPGTMDSLARVSQDGSTKYSNQLVPIVKGNLEDKRPTLLLSFAVAAWAFHLLGKNERGNGIEVFDGRKEELMDLVEQMGAKAITEDEQLFGSKQERDSIMRPFLDQVEDTYNKIRDWGVVKTLEAIMAV